MNDHFIHYFKRHLTQLRAEIEAYPDEKSIWLVPEGIHNCAGNLCYHLLGNLNHYIGHALGHTDYVRDRDLEFSIRNVPRTELLDWLDETTHMVERILGDIEDFRAPFPEGFWKWEGDIHFFLLRLLWHFTYHLGQVNYHRRLLKYHGSP